MPPLPLPGPTFDFAAKLRRLRGRSGIAAARVTVRTQLPWHWRLLAAAAAAGTALAIAGWAYDTGHRHGSDEIAAGQRRIAELEAEVSRLRQPPPGPLAEPATPRQAAPRAEAARADRARRRQADAAPAPEQPAHADDGSKNGALTIERLRVSAAGGGRYRYWFLVTRSGKAPGPEFRGQLQIVVTAANGPTLVLPRPDDPDADRFAIAFKRFKGIDGSFALPAGVRPKSVELRIVHQGTVLAAQAARL